MACQPRFIAALLLVLCSASAQAQQAGTAAAIGDVGKELIDLIAGLAEGERNPSERLSLEPVLRRADAAMQSLPSLRSALEAQRLAEAQRDEASAARLPQVSVNAGGGQRQYDFFGARYSGSGQTQSITGRQLIHDFGAVGNGVRAAEQRIEASRHRVDHVRSDFLLRALEAFYETQRALLQVRLSRENLQARRTFVSFIRQRAELGASSNADLVRADARVAEGLDLLAGAMQRLSVAQANYRQFYGAEAEPYLLPLEPARDDDGGTLEASLPAHPLMLEAALNVDALRADKQASRARLFGGVFLEVTVSEISDPGRSPQRNDSAFVVFRSDIYSGGSQVARIAQNESRLAQGEAEMERIGLELLRSLREAESEYAGHTAAVSARLLVFEATRDAYAVSKALYSFSRGSLYDVFRAQEDLFNAGARLIDGLIDRAKSRFRLLHASHRLLPLVRDSACPEKNRCRTSIQ